MVILTNEQILPRGGYENSLVYKDVRDFSQGSNSTFNQNPKEIRSKLAKAEASFT